MGMNKDGETEIHPHKVKKKKRQNEKNKKIHGYDWREGLFLVQNDR